MTVVVGLDAHGLDLKKVAKEFGKKFATGCSVTKSTTPNPGLVPSSTSTPSSSAAGAGNDGGGGGSGGAGAGGGGGGGGGGGEEIVVQGDVGDEIYDWILEKYHHRIPEENIEVR